MQQYLSLDPFPEVTAMLQRLKDKGMRTAILSNGSPTMLTAAVNSAKLSTLIDMALSVEAVGVYKPHPSVYQLPADKLAVPAPPICLLSPNRSDPARPA